MIKPTPTPGPLMETVWEALRFHLAFHEGRAETLRHRNRRSDDALRESHLAEARKIRAALDHLEANR